ncbi:MAG: hypothetical protein J0626_02775, partial [Rhodospirillaceae bacterium]|nr:hypothetical protein [Rhodospirillaceae bacterium]
QGHWQWIHACADEKLTQAKASNEALQQLLAYLTATLPSSLLANAFNLKQLNNDCNDGIFFQSNIPIGYGIGSSGALTAAVFHRYVHHANRNSSVALTELQQQLAYIESGLAPVLFAQPTYSWGYVSVKTIFDHVYLKKPAPPMVQMELVRVSKDNLGTWARQLRDWGFSDVDPKYIALEK